MSSGTEIYYFGCIGEVGHYMHTPDLRSVRNFGKGSWNPWGDDIDGLYESGRLHHKDGWTAYGLPDNTVDHRPGSHSTFLAKGEFSEAEMIELAQKIFPSITKRIGLRSSDDQR